MSLTKRAYEEMLENEEIQDADDFSSWIPETAEQPTECDDPDCLAPIQTGERLYRNDVSEETWHPSCLTRWNGFRSAVGRDNT